MQEHSSSRSTCFLCLIAGKFWINGLYVSPVGKECLFWNWHFGLEDLFLLFVFSRDVSAKKPVDVLCKFLIGSSLNLKFPQFCFFSKKSFPLQGQRVSTLRRIRMEGFWMSPSELHRLDDWESDPLKSWMNWMLWGEWNITKCLCHCTTPDTMGFFVHKGRVFKIPWSFQKTG